MAGPLGHLGQRQADAPQLPSQIRCHRLLPHVSLAPLLPGQGMTGGADPQCPVHLAQAHCLPAGYSWPASSPMLLA
jgi:hypothetical protein